METSLSPTDTIMQIVMVSCATVTSTGGACSPNTSQAAGDLYAVAGDATAGYAGDGGPATSAELYYPYGIAVDTDGNLFITDTNNYRIREVSCGTGISGCVPASGQTPGDIYTIAGTATAGFAGDTGPATSAELYYPLTAAVDNSGNLFIARPG